MREGGMMGCIYQVMSSVTTDKRESADSALTVIIIFSAYVNNFLPGLVFT